MYQRLNELNERRLRCWNEAQALLDSVQRERRDLNGEESAQWQRYNNEIDSLDAEIRSLQDRERREHEAGVIRAANPTTFGNGGHEHRDDDLVRRFLRGDAGHTLVIPIQAAMKERRLIRDGATAREARALAWDTGSIASAVPTSMARTLVEYLEAEVAMWRAPTTKFPTRSGEDMQFPRLATHSIATQVAGQGTTLAGTDPTFAQTTLGAYKYGQLVRVSNEVMVDTAVDIGAWLGRDLGRAVGRLIATDLVSGTGSGQPKGYMTECADAGMGSVHSGGSLLTPDYEQLIDIQYALTDAYRNRRSCAWLMRDSTAGTIRKLRDGAGGTEGSPIWQPSLVAGEPDVLLGHRVYTDPAVASMASNARTIAFGDMSAYYVRQAGDLMVELDRSVFFASDEVAVRAKMRVDGALLDDSAVVSLVQNV